MFEHYLPKSTHSISLPQHIQADDISIVIPVKNNQAGINHFLQRFFSVTPETCLPKEIIIVDNLSEPKLDVSPSYPRPVHLIRCNIPGAAAARNAGIQVTQGEWIWFTDSDCLPTEDSIAGYLGPSVAGAYAGNINITSNNLISKFYETQNMFQIKSSLHPQRQGKPTYLVTANCLVAKNAINAIGGFDEQFPSAGGEDVDFGVRLLSVCDLEYKHKSSINHEMTDGLKGLINRFIRYGTGNRLLYEKHRQNLPDKQANAASLMKHASSLTSLSNAFFLVFRILSYQYGYRIKSRAHMSHQK